MLPGLAHFTYVRVYAKQYAVMHGRAKNAINCIDEFDENKNGLF